VWQRESGEERVWVGKGERKEIQITTVSNLSPPSFTKQISESETYKTRKRNSTREKETIAHNKMGR
jgi:hypothetical protein